MQVPVWDIWIRLFHWTLAISVVVLLFTGLTGEFFFEWHRLLGEVVLLLIVFRLFWGVIGSSNIRLLRLLRSPREALVHLRHLTARDVPAEREHNAAGSWAVLLMLLLIGIQALTGQFIADEDELIEGALYGSIDSSAMSWLYRIHMINAKLILLIVCVHVVMIAAYYIIARRNLLLPMLSGKLHWPAEQSLPAVKFQQWWVGLLGFAVCALVVGWLVGWY
ncbi:MAG: cytochrome b/b6 domain-containing protein [Granulosicoccus sp.]|nr:cytochrome b/b6 domain-containing protein [Granulosicoccus sp.]